MRSAVWFGICALLACTGCSSWRYCGHLNTPTQARTETRTGLSHRYSIESIGMRPARKHWSYIYREILSQSAPHRLANANPQVFGSGPNAIPIRIRLEPRREERSGGFLKVLSWCTFRIIPSYTNARLPFDVIVEFPNGEHTAEASALTVDTLFSSMPYGAIALDDDPTAHCCMRLNGVFVAKSGNNGLLEDVFFRTLAENVRRQLARIEAENPEAAVTRAERQGARLSAEAPKIDVIALDYDSRTRKGVMRVRYGEGQFETARKWVRKNIETLARDKNVALTTGAIPAAAHFFIGNEKVTSGNVLEVEFETE